MAAASFEENRFQLAEKFKEEIGKVSWSWLRPHEKRKILFLVADELDLIEVAVAVAEDDKSLVKAWLDRGSLVQPNLKQVAKWEKNGGLFSGIVVKPFVFFKAVEV